APSLRSNESYHVFISYSSMDSAWAHFFIERLESTQLGLRVCYHERDFLPGRTIIENMVDSIHSSQKILLVLSKDFVQSKWCILEANLSVFRNCIERKPVIPVMLEPCSTPLHLSHLTYLDANDTFAEGNPSSQDMFHKALL
uniref:TIR domain-containing protein n=1 Tax=Latimeria chalumnae TaxID=7897 RepID=H3A6U8_LATCH